MITKEQQDGECPSCGIDWESDHLIGIEVMGVYDGVLYYQCPNCSAKFHRFPKKPSAMHLYDRAKTQGAKEFEDYLQ